MNTHRKTLLANCALLLVAVIWGGGFVAGKMALTGSTPFAILAYRFGFAALITFLLFFKRILRCGAASRNRGLLIGCLQLVALGVQLTGLQYTTSAKQSFLCTAYVAMVPFLSWILWRKKLNGREILSGVIALLGIGLISLQGSLRIGLGDSLSLCFSLLFGIQIVLVGKFAGDKTDLITLTFYQFLSAAVLALALCLFRGEDLRLHGTESLLGVAYLVVLNTVVAFLTQNVAQKFTSDTAASLLLSLESLFGFLFSVLYYRETPSLRFFAGCALCFGAILLNSYHRKENAS